MSRIAAWTGLAVGPALDQGVGLAELDALRAVDLVVPPELVPVAHAPAFACLTAPCSGADALRLPPPPRIVADGHALYLALGRSVATFEAARSASAEAPSAVLAAEARMMVLLAGIYRLETEIRARMARHSRA